MKILHVIPSMDPASGGPPIIAACFAAAQAQLGCDIEIIAYHFPAADERIAAALRTIPHIQKVKLSYLPPLTRLERIFAHGARRHFQSRFEQFDLIHLHGVWDPIIHAGSRAASACATPYVITLHGMIESWSLNQKRLKKRIALKLGYRWMLNNAAFLHCGTDDERRLTEKLHLKPPTAIVPNGIFPEEIDPLPAPGSFRARSPELAGAKIILFLSRLHFQKGVDVLGDAFAIISGEFPDAHLVVAGPDGGAQADLHRQITRLNLRERVHIVGPIYGPQKFAGLRDCDCFCLPSRHEGFSVAVLEAMACEAPVVITPGCHFPEVAQNSAGLIAELDAKSIAAAIAHVLRDPAAARQMGRNARALIEKSYTWPHLARRLVDACAQAIRA